MRHFYRHYFKLFYCSITIWKMKPQLERNGSQQSYHLAGVLNREDRGIDQTCHGHVLWLKRKKNNNCNEICKMETRRSLWPNFAEFCYFMSHLNQGSFYLLGETLELQGWLSMEEISLGVVKSLSVEAFKNRLEKCLSRTVCVAEPALGGKIDWMTFEVLFQPYFDD